MTDQENSIKLARLIGGMSATIENGSWAYCNWPGGIPDNFDPFTDANDCNALIKHLNGLGFDVVTFHNNEDRDWVRLVGDSAPTMWKGDNWMHGVCELALKVIESDEI